MAVITSGKTFANGEQLSADKLNQVISGATFTASDAVDGSTITLIGGAMAVKDSGIVPAKIATNAVETDKIADSSSKTTGVTFAKMQHISTAQVLGRLSASEGDVEEVGVVIGGSGDSGVLFDNDDMLDNSDTAGGSATRGATQQSIKAYIDSFAFKYHGTGEATVTTTTSFTDLDLSSIVGSNRALVVLKVRNSSTNTSVWFRAKDDDFDWNQSASQFAYGANSALTGTSDKGSYLVTMTNASGVVEHKSEDSNKDVKVTVMAFQKLLT